MAQVIELKDEELFIKTYKVRQPAKDRHSIQTTVPIEAFERDARRHKMTFQEALEKLRAVWRYNKFDGLHLSFEPCDDKEKEAPNPVRAPLKPDENKKQGRREIGCQ